MDGRSLRRILVMFTGLTIVSAGLTLVFLSMRAVMDIGGTCASGGPYVIAQSCPEGTEALLPLGIIGGLVGLWMYAVDSSKLPGPRLAPLAWSVLFLSLGWNFWEYGLRPPDGSDGLVWGWIICGVVFVAMGGLPLLALARPSVAKQLFWADAPGTSVRPKVATTPWRAVTMRPAPPSAESLPAALERLSDLHRTGALSDEEFQLAKRRILEDQS